MDRLCPICDVKMTEQHMIKYIDYYCNPKLNNHHYSARYKTNGEHTHLKARISEHGRPKQYFKINFMEGYTEIWEDMNGSRVRIDQVISYDFTDLVTMRNKLRTYLVFS